MEVSSASDLHLTDEAPPRFRIDGVLAPVEGAAPLSKGFIGPRLEAMGAGAGAVARESVDFLHQNPEVGRFRAHAFKEQGRWAVTFRRIPAEAPRFETLGLPPVVRSFVERPRGLVLVTGPTGSGKSTTLAALVDHLNRSQALHIVTIEDPIEFLHPSRTSLVHQREVGRDVRSFDAALKDALRQDPDVLLVGELRSADTIRAALTLAETGHLVLGTLHTGTAPEAVSRIVDGSRADDRAELRAQLAQVLEGVVSQRLVRRVGSGPGPKGRVIVAEVLVVTSAARAMIRDGRVHQLPSLLQSGRAQGMQTLTEALVQRVVRGEVDRAEAMRAAPDRRELERALDGHAP